VLLPVYVAVAAAIVFYLLVPIIGAFVLRGQWHRFRDRVAALGLAPRLRYKDLATARDEGRSEIGRFRLGGTVEAIEGTDKIWVRSAGVSALVDLSRAPLYVLSHGRPQAESIQRMSWASVSSLVEGTSIFVGGLLAYDAGRPVFVDRPEEPLIAVCHEGGEEGLVSRLVAAGRAPNEYWSNSTRISLALGLVAISVVLLLFRETIFPTVRSIVFLLGASPVLPFAPPGLVLFLLYYWLWRKALAARTERDLFRLALDYEAGTERSAVRYRRRTLADGEDPPPGATSIPSLVAQDSLGERTLFEPAEGGDPRDERFVVSGDPEAQARAAERNALISAVASGISFSFAIIMNFALAFFAWRSTL
jgi:hypothetical protein